MIHNSTTRIKSRFFYSNETVPHIRIDYQPTRLRLGNWVLSKVYAKNEASTHLEYIDRTDLTKETEESTEVTHLENRHRQIQAGSTIISWAEVRWDWPLGSNPLPTISLLNPLLGLLETLSLIYRPFIICSVRSTYTVNMVEETPHTCQNCVRRNFFLIPGVNNSDFPWGIIFFKK